MAHKNKTNYSPYKARQEQKGRAPKDAAELKGTHKKPEQIFSTAEASDRIWDIFRNHDYKPQGHSEVHQLAEFYRLLMLNQEHQNFTRLLKLRDIAIKHFLDSLIVAKLTKLQFPLMDMGTGPGFPGIPLKIIYPTEHILLAEGVQKRVAFLKSVREELRLQKLTIIGRNINPFFVYPVQGVITRAVEDCSNTLSNVISSIQKGGKVYLMKGPGVDPEIPKALDQWGEYFKLSEDIAYELPKTPHQRRLVVFEKIKNAELPNEEDQDFPLLEGE